MSPEKYPTLLLCDRPKYPFGIKQTGCHILHFAKRYNVPAMMR